MRTFYDEIEDKAYNPHTNFKRTHGKIETANILYFYDQKMTKDVLFDIITDLHKAGYTVKALGSLERVKYPLYSIKTQEKSQTVKYEMSTSYEYPVI